MVEFYQDLQKKYPIISIEDGCDENDWAGWKLLTDAIGDKTQLVGDDLFVTNTKFLKKGIDTQTANSILVKVNQIGTLTETLEAVEMAKEAGYTSFFPTAQVKQRMQRLLISLWLLTVDKLKQVHSAVQTVLQNTINSFVLKKSLVKMQSMAVS